MDTAKVTNEVEALKNKLRATWTSGDFGRIATSFEAGAVKFVERLDLNANSRVLDVACGTGNLAIPAARAGASVTGVDIVPDLIKQAKNLAAVDDLKVTFDVGDAEALPYQDGSFDVVMSMFGAMFAPRPDVVVSELTRACRPGGMIAMANWTPNGFIGQMFKTTGKHVPPPQGMPSPLLWGNEEVLRERFAGVENLTLTKRTLDFVFPFKPSDVVEHFRKFYGPTLKAFEALNAAACDDLRLDLEELWTKSNEATDGTTRVSAEYMEVLAFRANK